MRNYWLKAQQSFLFKESLSHSRDWHPLLFAMMGAFAMTLLLNGPFLDAVQQQAPGQLGLHLSLMLLLFLLNLLLLTLFSFGRWQKALFLLLSLIGASSLYFNQSFGVLIDKDMLQNALETDPAEARGLMSLALFWHLAQWMAFPVLMVLMVPLQKLSWRQRWVHQGASLLAVLVAISVLGAVKYADLAPFFRNFRDVKQLALPISPVVAATSLLSKQIKAQIPVEFVELGHDATRPAAIAGQKPKLLVLMVGETARADHFQLNGYNRPTNPMLSQLPVLSFRQVSSCGTATAHSLPCMFALQGRDDYNESKAKNSSNVLDILARTQVDVSWMDNNSGCKGVCDRVRSEFLFNTLVDERCTDGQCLDEVLVDALKKELTSTGNQDRIIVLHQLGSHGPEYYRRSGSKDKSFLPECTDKQLQLCQVQHIVNAYDNSLVATDRLLAEVIQSLQSQTHYDAAMLYVSDHGESLGENGVYLHGLPYWMAPSAQTHIPMIWWMSDDLSAHASYNKSCLQQQQDQALSHDYLFHSLLGFFRVSTSLYQPKLDFLAPCQVEEAV